MRAMYFEHLVAINDPAQPMLAPLTRAQLWRGLWQRVENPMLFLPGLVACTMLARSESGCARELDFGATRIRDQVSFVAEEWLRFDIEAGPDHAGGSLVIRLEEPQPGALYLRFTYQTTLAQEGPDSAYLEYVKSAYHASDLETVRVIRLLLSQGTPQ